MADTTENLQNFAFDTDETFFNVGPDGKEIETKPDATDTNTVIAEVKTDEDDIELEDDVEKIKAPKPKATTVGTGAKPATVEKTETTPSKKKTKEGEEEEVVEDEEPVFFDQGTKNKNTPDATTTKNEDVVVEENEDKFYSTLAGELKEKGIFQNVEIPTDKDISEDEFFELQDKEIEARVDETFEAFFTELDEDGVNFLKFKKNGGSTADFIAGYGQSLDLETLDPEDETQRNLVLQHYLSTVDKLDAEETADRIKWLDDHGKSKTYATKYFDKIKESDAERRKTLLDAQETASKARVESIQKFNNELLGTIKATDKVGAFPITKDDQKELGSYITKPSVKVGKNKYIPAFQSELSKVLRGATKEDQQKLILLAKLFKTNFAIDGVVAETTTKVVKKIESKLKDAKTGVKAHTSGSYANKSLSDFFVEQ